MSTLLLGDGDGAHQTLRPRPEEVNTAVTKLVGLMEQLTLSERELRILIERVTKLCFEQLLPSDQISYSPNPRTRHAHVEFETFAQYLPQNYQEFMEKCGENPWFVLAFLHYMQKSVGLSLNNEPSKE